MNDKTQSERAIHGRTSLATTPEISCPVCRAKQNAQSECRRCGADLNLFVKAILSLDEANRQLALAQRSGQEQLASKWSNYLTWLTTKTTRTATG